MTFAVCLVLALTLVAVGASSAEDKVRVGTYGSPNRKGRRVQLVKIARNRAEKVVAV
jgi:hypothetical protein